MGYAQDHLRCYRLLCDFIAERFRAVMDADVQELLRFINSYEDYNEQTFLTMLGAAECARDGHGAVMEDGKCENCWEPVGSEGAAT